jgi:O-antigen/teichoic acid export membrane protein
MTETEKIAPPAAPSEAGHLASFFRQSGWMMSAAFVAGLFNYPVHGVARHMSKPEYGVFCTLLRVVDLIALFAIGIQAVFMQRAAAALHDDHHREVAGMLRGVLRIIFFIWLTAAAVILIFHRQFLLWLQITNPVALWLTVAIGLAQMCLPIVFGLLQGRQNFLWRGLADIFNGFGRFAVICILVLVLGAQSPGAMAAVLTGLTVAVLIGAWHNRDYLRLKPKPVEWGQFWLEVLPFTFGLAAPAFMLIADMLFVQAYFPSTKTAFFGAAGLIGRALVFFILPLTSVLFPKIVQSAAREQKTNVLAHALCITALVGACAALAATLFPSLPLRIIYDQSFLVAVPLVPWFVWSMLPLALANVLISALLARRRFAAVPWLAVIAASYGVALYFVCSARNHTFKSVIQTLGEFSLLLLGVCAWFIWGSKSTIKGSVAAETSAR